MATVRRDIVFNKWKELRAKKCISMDDLDDLMYAVEKLLMNYDQTVESRDKYKAKLVEVMKNGR